MKMASNEIQGNSHPKVIGSGLKKRVFLIFSIVLMVSVGISVLFILNRDDKEEKREFKELSAEKKTEVVKPAVPVVDENKGGVEGDEMNDADKDDEDNEKGQGEPGDVNKAEGDGDLAEGENSNGSDTSTANASLPLLDFALDSPRRTYKCLTHVSSLHSTLIYLFNHLKYFRKAIKSSKFGKLTDLSGVKKSLKTFEKAGKFCGDEKQDPEGASFSSILAAYQEPFRPQEESLLAFKIPKETLTLNGEFLSESLKGRSVMPGCWPNLAIFENPENERNNDIELEKSIKLYYSEKSKKKQTGQTKKMKWKLSVIVLNISAADGPEGDVPNYRLYVRRKQSQWRVLEFGNLYDIDEDQVPLKYGKFRLIVYKLDS